MSTTETSTTAKASYDLVNERYTFRANNPVCTTLRTQIAQSLGYDQTDTMNIPQEANLGEGCGNPLLIANLSEGETVVDLGCGGGFDALQASVKVGATGKVIGIDMNPQMLDLANKNAKKMGVTNCEFMESRISSLPIPDNSVDCVISNCVLNLVPEEDKITVIRELYRILRPRGRLAISDFLALKPLPEAIKEDTDLVSGCVSGAIEASIMAQSLYDIGFDDVLLVNTQQDLSMYKEGEEAKSVTPCCAGKSCRPGYTSSGRKELDYDLNDWISSFQIFGHKWSGKTEQTQPHFRNKDLTSKKAEQTQSQNTCAPKTGCC